MADHAVRYFARAAALLEVIDADPTLHLDMLVDPRSCLHQRFDQVAVLPRHDSQAEDCVAYWLSRLDQVLAGTADRYTVLAHAMASDPRPDAQFFAVSMLMSHRNLAKSSKNA